MNKQPAKKTVTKKTTATKKTAAPAKKTAAKKTLKTSIVAYADVGFGNMLYIRGEGAGLSWEKGASMKNISSAEWVFDTTKASGMITFKFLINDQIWAESDNLTIQAGSKSISSPEFVW